MPAFQMLPFSALHCDLGMPHSSEAALISISAVFVRTLAAAKPMGAGSDREARRMSVDKLLITASVTKFYERLDSIVVRSFLACQTAIRSSVIIER